MDDKVKGSATVVLLGAVLAAIGTLMPWVKVDTAFGGLSRNGLDYSSDAPIILILAIVCGLAALGKLTGWAMPSFIRPSVIIAGGIATTLTVVDYVQIKDRIDENASEYALGSVGTGVYLTIVGCALLFVGGLALRSATKPAPGPTMRWNPPPGWPQMPDGFKPPAKWRPDPSWPAAPEGWVWWVPQEESKVDAQT